MLRPIAHDAVSRFFLVALATPFAAVAQTPPPAAPAAPIAALPGARDFISPMGEPFRSKDELSGAEHWFRQADANGDGKLTADEFRADALRFFATLDTDHDGDIGPMELEHYEEVVAPEVTAGSTNGDPEKVKTDDEGKIVIDAPYPDRVGAGRYGYLAIPEPVIYADTNFDRAVSRREFATAADARFRMLDRNGDGRITRDELPVPSKRKR